MSHIYKIEIKFETNRSLACDELEEIVVQAITMVEEPVDRDGNDMDVIVKQTTAKWYVEHPFDKEINQ